MKPGDSLGRYRIDGELGSGGMGIVYKAYDTLLHRQVAVKLLSGQRDSTNVDRLLHEARVASALNHPNICTVHEVADDGTRLFIVMEYIDGRPLSRVIHQLALPVDTIVHYGTQIADAIAHAHERRVIHRDLKSANVIVTPSGRVKVLDFGLATYIEPTDVDAITRSATAQVVRPELEGSLPFMAPEVLCGERPDERSDIWSLGIVLYEMAAGVLPFHGRTTYELTAAILQDPPAPLPSRVPPNLSSVIRGCLEKQPGMRYQRASEVLAALQTIRVDVASIAAVPESGAREEPRHTPRRWRRAGAMLAAAILVVAVIVAVVWRMDSRDGAATVAAQRTTSGSLASQPDRVTIVDISPKPGTMLQRGTTVAFRATLRYELTSADSAIIAMVVQDSANPRYRLGSIPQPTARIMKGNGTTMLSDMVAIPVLTAPFEGYADITIHFPMSLPGTFQTSIVATANYPVQ